MHPFLYPDYIEAVHGDRIRYRRAGKRIHPEATTPARQSRPADEY
ncbi:MAG: hypothetical protein RIB65_20110 [Ilumatobacter fluminis]|uniref:Uncharacterized protein n=1 Tax=Ilumatobacter fluminis TaxID=467091 RepID=A0A4R7I2L4_9ACTN|nr:hypothetical protein [Ilumatobacter fluminis]TDT17460.1 hypothetical protein BDK89_3070 [Ilumatobacter fluminis]